MKIVEICYLNFIVKVRFFKKNNLQGIQAKLHGNFQSSLDPRNKIPDTFVDRGKNYLSYILFSTKVSKEKLSYFQSLLGYLTLFGYSKLLLNLSPRPLHKQ